MKGKITDSLKPSLTKKPSEVGYWKLNEMPGSSIAWNKNINSWISEVKQYEKTMANKQSQNGRGEYQIDKISYAKGGSLLMVESRELWTFKHKLWVSKV